MNVAKIIFALLFFCLIKYVPAFAQENANLKFETLTINDGLSQGFVSGITQDKKGLMWFTTLDGLNQYDGYKFTIYRHKDDDSNSIASNFVYNAFEDSNQRFWISTWNNGLDYFDRAHHRFYHFFKGSYIRSVCEDDKGNLWTTMNDTILVCIKVRTLKSNQINTSPVALDTTQISFPAGSRINVMVDDKKNIYISSKFFINKILPAHNNRYTMQKILSFNSYETSELKQDPVTHKYYLQINNELFEFADNRFINPLKIADKFDYYKFYIDSSSHLWFGNQASNQNNSYVKVINLKTHTSKDIIASNNLNNKFFGYIYSPFADSNGTLWLGTAGFGILKYSQTQNRFNLTLPQNKFFGLMPVGDSDLLVNYRLRLHINKDYTVRLDTLHPNIAPVFDLLKLTDMGVDSVGNYWIGNVDKLIQYNPALNKVLTTTIIHDASNKILSEKLSEVFDKSGTLKSNHTYGIIGFFIDNNYVLMCLDDLFLSLNTQTKKITAYPFVKISKNIAFSLTYYKDAQGFVWINGDNSCYRLNINNGKCTKYAFNENINRNIRSFCDDPLQPAKYIWLGTLSGLIRMNKQTGICTNYNGKNGLPKALVYGILSDSMNNFWLSSTDGLYHLNLSNLNVEKFDITDGLQSNEFNTYSYAKMKNGLLFFGGLNGLNFFKPEDIKPLKPPATIITDFRLFGKSVNFGEKNSLLKQDITYTGNVSASYKSNIITIEFAGLDYSKKQGLQYRYKLNGFDNDWNYSGTSNTATYTNLDPGSYNFIVEASNTNNTWGPGASFQIEIMPLWWQTWWFKILIIITLLVSLYLVSRLRLQQALKVEKIRNHIASDLHDEIGSALSAITIYSKIMQGQSKPNNQNNQEVLLQKISENSHLAMDSMNDIVWSINTKNDDFDNIIIRMQDYATQLLGLKDYTVHFDINEHIPAIKLKMQKRRDFYLIYKEALNNIVKHANGKNVWICMSENKNIILLSIKDDGIGYDENNMRNGGNGLSNMTKRAKNIHGKITIKSKPGEGTELQLNFPD